MQPADIDRRTLTGFGTTQCPGCGSTNIDHETYRKHGGGPHEIDDHVTVLECGDCGYTGGAQ